MLKQRVFFAQSKPASIQWGLPIDSTPGVTPTAQAITVLWCITGNLDVPGGNIIARHAFEAVAYALPGAEGVIKLKSEEIDKKRIGADTYGPFNKFIWRSQTDKVLDQIYSDEPYPIKGMWIQAANIIAGISFQPKKWREAFNKLDFIAAVDTFMTPTTQLADIVLPAASFLEKESVRSWWIPLQTINKAITVEDCKPDVEINFELAKRFDPDFQWDTIHDLFDDIIKPSGMIELYSVLREEWELEPIAHYEEPPFTPISQPDLAKEYPLILSTGRRSFAFFNAEHRMIPWLRQIDPDPTVEINPKTARSIGISNGEWVWVENWLGKQIFKAKVTPIVPPEMVMAAHGWWYPEEDGAEPSLFGVWKSNINQLIPMGCQGKDGLGAPLKSLLCKVYKTNGKEADHE